MLSKSIFFLSLKIHFVLANSSDTDGVFTVCYRLCTHFGAQWLRGRVLNSRPRGGGFEPHQRHFVVSLCKTHLSLLSTGSTQEDLSNITEKLLTGM